MPWLTPEEFAAAQAKEIREARDAYTWENARSDLAYGTPLTIFDAGRVTRTFEEETDLHPYDVFPLLLKVFEDRDPVRSEKIETVAWNMVKMIKLAGVISLGEFVDPPKET